MIRTDVILQERHQTEVHIQLAAPDGEEGAAYVLFSRAEIGEDPWTGTSRVRYVSYEVVPIPDEDRVSASAEHVTWGTASFVRLCKRAKEEGLVPAVVHSHPGGFDRFSEQDDRNERDLHMLARNRNRGAPTELLSVVQVGDALHRARVWRDDGDPVPCQRVSIVGSSLVIQDVERHAASETHDRQALAFGPEVNDRLRHLSLGVIGCGGTGSPLVHMLARLGVGRLLVVDDDVVEKSNLNRLHGATLEDAEDAVPKVAVMRREVERMGLDVDIHPIKDWVDEATVRDALRSCDVVFGCTDDHAGRLFLNRLAVFYAIPVIDVGLALLPRADGSPGLQEMAARVTVLVPGAPCVICRGIADPIRAREEDLERRAPEEFARQKAEAYVVGGGNPAPAVVTFTTEAATMAANELLQGLVDYRGEGCWAWNRYRRLDKAQERPQGAKPREGCPLCDDRTYWGLGDVEPFLDRTG